MNLIKCEMHLHTKGGSGCASVETYDIAKAYHKMGYGAITVTNHYIEFLCKEMADGNSKKYAEIVISLYEKLKKDCKKYKIKVYFGMELTPYRPNQRNVDLLVYGLTPELLLKNSELYMLNDKDLFDFCNANNITLCQAHPFRDYCRLYDINFIHGIEAYNGYPNYFGNNDLALPYAQVNNKIKVSGSDFHRITNDLPKDSVKGGIVIPDTINSSPELSALLKSDKHNLIIDGIVSTVD